MTGWIALASYKLRFHDEHVRAVPARDAAGCAFAGPGVDVRGAEARAILATAAPPLRAWLEAREPGVVLRTMSMSRGKNGDEAPRVLMTLEATTPGERPRVIRFDMPHAGELVEAAAAAEARIVSACEAALAKRAKA